MMNNLGKDTKTVGTVKNIGGKSSVMYTNGTVDANNLSIGAVIQELKGREDDTPPRKGTIPSKERVQEWTMNVSTGGSKLSWAEEAEQEED
ncbi:hypothetical protein KY284_019944 [Solanum tuberosum]|nr:hypothetical protein KY284_019944 [Solanum tuberosum]